MKNKPLHLRKHDGPIYFREFLKQRHAGKSLEAARAAGRVKLMSFREEIKRLPAGPIGKTNQLKEALGL
jgi:hypothetical protein